MSTGEIHFPLGLNLEPEGPAPTRLTTLASAMGAMTEAEIIKLVGHKGRTAAADQFPWEMWGVRQTVNSCNGWAAAAALGRARVRRGLPPVVLSGTLVYAHISGGRDQGSMLKDGREHIEQIGTCPVDMIPKDTHDIRRIPQDAIAVSANYRAFECYAVRTMLECYTALALGFPVVAAVHVGRNFQNIDSDGNAGVDSGPGNHAICLADLAYRDGKLRPYLTNSWGNWGVRGCCWSIWDHFERTTGNHEFYAIRSTLDGNKQDNPPEIRNN